LYDISNKKLGSRKNIKTCIYMDKELHISTNNTTETTVDSVVFSIISQFVERANVGKAKYGTTLDREDLNILDWIQHAQEEHMDAILYLEKLKKVYENKNK